jgi:hypothetical protein
MTDHNDSHFQQEVGLPMTMFTDMEAVMAHTLEVTHAVLSSSDQVGADFESAVCVRITGYDCQNSAEVQSTVVIPVRLIQDLTASLIKHATLAEMHLAHAMAHRN